MIRLRSLDHLESATIAEIQVVVGGKAPSVYSATWADSSSHDSYKKDTGGNSAKKDTPIQ